MNSHIVVFVTVTSMSEGKKIARALLKDRLAACVNTVRGVKSLYWWKGRIGSSQEELLVIKTRRAKFSALTKCVKALHSYTVPEIIALPVVAGQRDYLRWIDASTK